MSRIESGELRGGSTVLPSQASTSHAPQFNKAKSRWRRALRCLKTSSCFHAEAKTPTGVWISDATIPQALKQQESSLTNLGTRGAFMGTEGRVVTEDLNSNAVLRNCSLLDLSPQFLEETHKILDLRRCVDECQVYRGIRDCPSFMFSNRAYEIKTGTNLTAAAATTRQKWKDALGTVLTQLSVTTTGEQAPQYTLLLETLQNLPERFWNEEWRIVRSKILATEKLLETQRVSASVSSTKSLSLRSGPSAACWSFRRSSTVIETKSVESLVDLYAEMTRIQQEFVSFCTIVFHGILNPQLRQPLASCLTQYYRRHVPSETDVLKGNQGHLSQQRRRRRRVTRFGTTARRKETIHQRDTCGNLVDRTLDVFFQILNFKLTADEADPPNINDVTHFSPNCSLRATDCSALVDWATAGFEFHGVWFQLIRGVENWKTYKRELAFCRRSIFENAYNCPPLICLLDAFQFQLGASALLLPARDNNHFIAAASPPQLPTSLIPLTVSKIKKTLAQTPAGYSSGHIKRILPELPNPGFLLTAYAPRLVPLDAGGNDFTNDTLLAASLMIAAPIFHKKKSFSRDDVARFHQSLVLCQDVLNKHPVPQKALLETGMRDYLSRWVYGSSFVPCDCIGSQLITPVIPCADEGKKLEPVVSCCCPRTRLYALAFVTKREEPEIMPLPFLWSAAAVTNFAAAQFHCDKSAVLPYDPMLEHGYYEESRDSPWKVEISGYRCSVWVPTVWQSPHGSVHELRSSLGPPRRPLKTLRRSLQLPWEATDFVIVPCPMPIYLRPEMYIPTHTSLKPDAPPNSRLAIETIAALIENEVPAIHSSGALHQTIHCFGLSVSVTLWELWMFANREKGKKCFAVRKLVACDLLAAGVKRVIQYYSADARSDSHASIKAEMTQCLLHAILNIPFLTGSVVRPENVNVATRFLHLALWCSLIRALQIIDADIQSNMVQDVCNTARRHPGTLRMCILERCRLQSVYPARGLSPQPHKMVDSRSLWFSLDRASYPTLNSCFRSGSSASFAAERFPSTRSDQTDLRQETWSPSAPVFCGNSCCPPKLLVTVPGRDIMLRMLFAINFEAEAHTDGTFIRPACLLGTSVNYADCILPKFATYIPVVMNDKESDSAADSALVSMCLFQLARYAPDSREIMRISLLRLLRKIFRGIELILQNNQPRLPTSSEVDSVVVAVIETEATLPEPALISSALLVKGLSKLLTLPYNEDEATDCFKEALNCLLVVWGDPRHPGESGVPSMLYLAWLLALAARLRQKNDEGQFYEQIFRAVRNLTPCCPLPLCFPLKVDADKSNNCQSTALVSNSRRQLWKQHSAFLKPAALRWIAAMHPLNNATFGSHGFYPDGYDVSPKNLYQPRVLSFGDNTDGSLGLGPPSQFALKSDVSMRNSELPPCQDVWWTPEPTPISLLKDENVIDVVAGAKHNLALTAEGAVYSWGSNRYGQLGRPVAKNYVTGAHLEQQANFNWLDIKYAKHNYFDQPRLASLADSSTIDYSYTSFYREACSMQANVIKFFKEPISQVSCGYDFSAVVTKSGSLFMWGCNVSGQLGLGDFQPRFEPTIVATLLQSTVLQVSCGYAHTAAVLTPDVLWLWGSGGSGQLGCAYPYSNSSSPQTTTNPSAALKSATCVCVPLRLRIFQCEAHDGRLESAFAESRLVKTAKAPDASGLAWRQDPESKEYFVTVFSDVISDTENRHNEEVQFISVSCGYSHTLAVDLTNAVWSWGSGEHGELGLGVELMEVESSPLSWPLLLNPPIRELETKASLRHTPCRLPGRYFDYQRVAFVTAGTFVSAAVDHRGELWIWGSNTFNALSVPKEDIEKAIQPLRCRTFYPESVVGIVFGWSGVHQSVVTQNGIFSLWGAQMGALAQAQQETQSEIFHGPPPETLNFTEHHQDIAKGDYRSQVPCTVPHIQPQFSPEGCNSVAKTGVPFPTIRVSKGRIVLRHNSIACEMLCFLGNIKKLLQQPKYRFTTIVINLRDTARASSPLPFSFQLFNWMS